MTSSRSCCRRARLQDALRLADRITAALSEPFELGPRQIRPVGVHRHLHRARRPEPGRPARRGGPGDVRRQGPRDEPVRVRPGPAPRDARPPPARAGPSRRRGPARAPAASTSRSCTWPATTSWGSRPCSAGTTPPEGPSRPAQFIPLAEANGAILDIGDWVLEESLRQLRLWDAASPGHRTAHQRERLAAPAQRPRVRRSRGRHAGPQRARPRPGDARDHRGGLRRGRREHDRRGSTSSSSWASCWPSTTSAPSTRRCRG